MESEIGALKEELATWKEEGRKARDDSLRYISRIQGLEGEKEALKLKADEDRQTILRLEEMCEEQRNSIQELNHTFDREKEVMVQNVESQKSKKRLYKSELKLVSTQLKVIRSENVEIKSEVKSLGNQVSMVKRRMTNHSTLEFDKEMVEHTLYIKNEELSDLKKSRQCIEMCGRLRNATFNPCRHSVYCTYCINTRPSLKKRCPVPGCAQKEVQDIVHTAYPVMF